MVCAISLLLPLVLSPLPLCFHPEPSWDFFSASHLCISKVPTSSWFPWAPPGRAFSCPCTWSLVLLAKPTSSGRSCTAQHGVCDSTVTPSAQTCTLLSPGVRPRRAEDTLNSFKHETLDTRVGSEAPGSPEPAGGERGRCGSANGALPAPGSAGCRTVGSTVPGPLLGLLCTLLVEEFHHLTSVDCEQDESFHLNKFLMLIRRPEWQHEGCLCTWSEVCSP